MNDIDIAAHRHNLMTFAAILVRDIDALDDEMINPVRPVVEIRLDAQRLQRQLRAVLDEFSTLVRPYL